MSPVEQPRREQPQRPEDGLTEGIRRDPDEWRITGGAGRRRKPSPYSCKTTREHKHHQHTEPADDGLCHLGDDWDIASDLATGTNQCEERGVTRRTTERIHAPLTRHIVIHKAHARGETAGEREVFLFVTCEWLVCPVAEGKREPQCDRQTDDHQQGRTGGTRTTCDHRTVARKSAPIPGRPETPRPQT